MRWGDERYVRVYVRDTGDWNGLGWEAQSLLLLALRKCDRAGILDVGKRQITGLASMVGMPEDVVSRALPRLLEDGCLIANGTQLVFRNFIEAQESAQSDAQRSRERRARDRDIAASRNVVVASQTVTETSRPRTTTHDEALRAVPSRAVPEDLPLLGRKARLAYSDPFDKAWRQYGRKEQKPNAWEQWKIAAKEIEGGEEALLEKVAAALTWQGPEWAKDGWKFAPYFERYLKRKKWEDEKPSAGREEPKIWKITER